MTKLWVLLLLLGFVVCLIIEENVKLQWKGSKKPEVIFSPTTFLNALNSVYSIFFMENPSLRGACFLTSLLTYVDYWGNWSVRILMKEKEEGLLLTINRYKREKRFVYFRKFQRNVMLQNQIWIFFCFQHLLSNYFFIQKKKMLVWAWVGGNKTRIPQTEGKGKVLWWEKMGTYKTSIF